MATIVRDMSLKTVLPPAVKRKVQREIERVLRPTYFRSIPLSDIADRIAPLNVHLIDDDGTEWSGFLTGADGRADFELAYNGLHVKNALFHLTWHKMDMSGNYEVIGYIS